MKSNDTPPAYCLLPQSRLVCFKLDEELRKMCFRLVGKLLLWSHLIFSTLVSSFFVRPRAAMIINVFPKQTKLNCGRKF